MGPIAWSTVSIMNVMHAPGRKKETKKKKRQQTTTPTRKTLQSRTTLRHTANSPHGAPIKMPPGWTRVATAMDGMS